MTGATLGSIFEDGEVFVEKSADDIVARVFSKGRFKSEKAEPKNYEKIAISRLVNNWPSTVPDTYRVAYGFGIPVAAGVMQRSAALRILRMFFNTKLDKKHWPATEAAFLQGCNASVSREEMIRALNEGPASTDIALAPFKLRRTSEIPRIDFLYGNHLIRGFVTVDAATTGVGKSTHMIADVVAIVTGRNLLGVEVRKPKRAWLHNGEDPPEVLDGRFAATCAHHRVREADIGGRLIVTSGRDMPIVLVKEEKGAIVINNELVAAIKQAIILNKIDVWSVDPLVTLHSVSENDNTKMAVVTGIFAQIAHETRCAIHLVHHTRKGDGGEVTVEDMRGAGSLASTARAVRVISPMTLEEARVAGIKPTDRFRYFRVTNGKSNLSARTGVGEWRQLISYPMGNQERGNFVGEPQDFVAVAAKWSWPSAASLIENVTAEQLVAIKANMRGGKRENAQSLDWAGHAVARILEMDMDDPGEKDTVKRMLKAWIAAGHMKVETQFTEKREQKKFIVPVDPAEPQ